VGLEWTASRSSKVVDKVIDIGAIASPCLSSQFCNFRPPVTRPYRRHYGEAMIDRENTCRCSSGFEEPMIARRFRRIVDKFALSNQVCLLADGTILKALRGRISYITHVADRESIRGEKRNKHRDRSEPDSEWGRPISPLVNRVIVHLRNIAPRTRTRADQQDASGDLS